MRDAAQFLIVRDAFALKRRVCYTCQRAEDVVILVEHS